MRFSLLILFVLSFHIGKAQQNVYDFIPGLLSEMPNVRDVTISPDEKEMYITIESYDKGISCIARIEKHKKSWKAPKLAEFSGKYKDIEPAFSPDGLQLFFVSDRPGTIEDTSRERDFDIWYVTRSSMDAPWSEPVNPGLPLNTVLDEFYPSIAANGNLYFTSSRLPSSGKEDIWMSQELAPGKYAEPEALSKAINTSYYEFNAYISPDESLLLFTSYGRDDDLGGGDLYYSRRDQDGAWEPSIHLEGINSPGIDYCPFVDQKNKNLYFTSDRCSVIPDATRSKDIFEVLKKMENSSKSAGRIYYVPIEQTPLKGTLIMEDK